MDVVIVTLSTIGEPSIVRNEIGLTLWRAISDSKSKPDCSWMSIWLIPSRRMGKDSESDPKLECL